MHSGFFGKTKDTDRQDQRIDKDAGKPLHPNHEYTLEFVVRKSSKRSYWFWQRLLLGMGWGSVLSDLSDLGAVEVLGSGLRGL